MTSFFGRYARYSVQNFKILLTSSSMALSISINSRQFRASFLALALATLICAGQPASARMNDPFESFNRMSHSGNLLLDRYIAKPASEFYGKAVPPEIANMVQRMSSNLALPSAAMNQFLQFQFERGMQNSLRFLVNSTVGLAGAFDVAAYFGFYEYRTDFGSTLHNSFGLGSGPYLVLPAFGPSNLRDGIGFAVDTVFNPLYWLAPSLDVAGVVSFNAIASIGKRHANATIVDPLFYESEDSYTQTKLYFNQNREFELVGGIVEEDYLDPYIGTGDIYEELFGPF